MHGYDRSSNKAITQQSLLNRFSARLYDDSLASTPATLTRQPRQHRVRPRLRRLLLHRLRLRHSGAGDSAFIDSVSDTRGLAASPSSTPSPTLGGWRFTFITSAASTPVRRVDFFRRVDSGPRASTSSAASTPVRVRRLLPPRRLRSAASTASTASLRARRLRSAASTASTALLRRVDSGPPRTAYSPWPHPMLSRVLRRTGHKQIQPRPPLESLGGCASQASPKNPRLPLDALGGLRCTGLKPA